MAELKIYLSNSLNEKFRRIAMSVFGYGRGSLSKAAEEAFTRWCSEHEHSRIPEKATEHPQDSQGRLSRDTDAHINPDEREDVGRGPKSFGEKSLNSSAPSAYSYR